MTWGLHVCYGNRYARPSWEGHYDFLFPAVLDADVDQLVLEFARKGYDDLQLIRKYGWDRSLGLGVIDVMARALRAMTAIAQYRAVAVRALHPQRTGRTRASSNTEAHLRQRSPRRYERQRPLRPPPAHHAVRHLRAAKHPLGASRRREVKAAGRGHLVARVRANPTAAAR